MGKIVNDAYFTPVTTANKCIDKVLDLIGGNNISEIIEPSVGSGSFLHHQDTLIHFGYDIEPMCKSEITSIIKGDFLQQDIKYLEGRLVIGNPPYGRCLSLARKFFKRSIEIGDYIAFILPISQLDNVNTFYEFDLIHSEDLGLLKYSDRELHCCFNIYKRPVGELNKKPSHKLKDVIIVRQDSKKYNTIDKFDFRFCYWGDGSAGKIVKGDKKYAGEYKIVINNDDLREDIKRLFETYDWKNTINAIAMRRIKQWQIIEILKDNIIGIS